MQKFFLYARKSTDIEDKQILSIEAQITELRAFAKQNNLDIVEEFIEKQSAKIPGRPIFNAMIKKIENGEANGVLADCFSINSSTTSKLFCWAKARNSVICASIDKICLSSISVDLRAYKKNFCILFFG